MRIQHLATAITFTAAFVVGSVAVTAQQPETLTYPKGESVASDYLPSASALRTELRLEAKGMHCTETSVLTDTVIVDVDQYARVVSLDEAFKLAKQGAWVRSYCTEES